jgi:hypothetical protein
LLTHKRTAFRRRDVRADEKLTAFVELEAAIRRAGCTVAPTRKGQHLPIYA